MSRSMGGSHTCRPFDFDERVVVLEASSDGQVVPGDIGYVVGKDDPDVPNHEGVASYGVFIEKLRIVYIFKGTELSR